MITANLVLSVQCIFVLGLHVKSISRLMLLESVSNFDPRTLIRILWTQVVSFLFAVELMYHGKL